MKREIAFLAAVSVMLCFALGAANTYDMSGWSVNHVSLAENDAGLTDAETEMFENIIGKWWWYGNFPYGEVPLDDYTSSMVVRCLLNEGVIPAVQNVMIDTDMGSFAVAEDDMELLFRSLTGGSAPDRSVLTQDHYFSYEDGYYVGAYAAGEMAIYYPEADITEVSISGGAMTLSGFLHISCNMDHAMRACKFEAVLRENSGSIFSGYSFASVYVGALDRTVREISANSVLSPQSGNTYVAGNAFDEDYRTAWVEGSAGTGVGSSVVFSFDGTETVYGISVLPGYWKNQDVYYQNGRPTVLDISFSNGSHQTMYLMGTEPEYAGADESYEYMLFEEPVETSFVTVTIADAVSGAYYEDTCITEIQLLK